MMKKFLTLALLAIVCAHINIQVYAHDGDELEFFHKVDIKEGKPLNITDCVSLAYQNTRKLDVKSIILI